MPGRSLSLFEQLVETISELLALAPWWGICAALVTTATAAVIEYSNKSGVGVLYFVLAILGVAVAMVAAYRKAIRGLTFRYARDIETIRTLDWREFETLIGETYRRQGYFVEETGQSGADGGIDLKLKRNGETTIVQCKHWRMSRVGVKPLRELGGVMSENRAATAIFVASGSYTLEAREYARRNNVQLIDGPALVKLLALLLGDTAVQAVSKTEFRLAPLPEQENEPVRERDTVETPDCPKCGEAMVLRLAKRGRDAGSQFWGCSQYPACRGTRNNALHSPVTERV